MHEIKRVDSHNKLTNSSPLDELDPFEDPMNLSQHTVTDIEIAHETNSLLTIVVSNDAIGSRIITLSRTMTVEFVLICRSTLVHTHMGI